MYSFKVQTSTAVIALSGLALMAILLLFSKKDAPQSTLVKITSPREKFSSQNSALPEESLFAKPRRRSEPAVAASLNSAAVQTSRVFSKPKNTDLVGDYRDSISALVEAKIPGAEKLTALLDSAVETPEEDDDLRFMIALHEVQIKAAPEEQLSDIPPNP